MNLRAIGLALVLSSCSYVLTNAQYRAEVITSVAYRVVVDCNNDNIADSSGSATAVSPTLFVTANHVFKEGCNSPAILVVNEYGKIRQGVLDLRDIPHDRAYFRLAPNQPPSMKWAEHGGCRAPRPGDEVFMYVGDSELPMFLKRGDVSDASDKFLVFSAHVVPGNSGGGVFDSDGCLIGVISGGNFKDVAHELYGVATRY